MDKVADKPLCMIPARGGSKRLPRKNLTELGGKPLIVHTIEAALECRLFDQVIVSTEDREIAQVAEQNGATVPYLRPAHLATDEARVVHVCIQMLDFFESKDCSYESMCVLLPTSPLRNAEDIRGTYDRLMETGADFAMAVTSYLYPPWQALVEEDGRLKPYWDADIVSKKSQKIPPLWVDSGAVTFVRVDAFRIVRDFYGPNLVGYFIPPERAIDVDNAFQLHLARLLLNGSFRENSRGNGTLP